MAKKNKSEKNRRFDRRAMEVMSAKINQLMSGQNFGSLEEANKFLMANASGMKLDGVGYQPQSPIEQAQQIMWEAFDEPSAKKRIKMAEEALAISPDCADAYVLLAEDRAKDLKEEIELYRKGTEAGRRALGDEVINDPETPFWSDLKTRPFMRAMSGLAAALNVDGQNAEAIELWKELLRLNPNDNQGVRTTLLSTLVHVDRLAEAEELMKQYDTERSAFMMYSRALCLFKKLGDCSASQNALNDAIDENPHVIEILSGLRKMPNELGDSYAPGSPEEAHGYIVSAAESWVSSGAVKWLAIFIKREVQKDQLAKTFPGMTFAPTRSNVIDLFGR